ncbi:MAG TPA: TcpQ domain-containing protein [Alphaproteobacteria bacterium]|nr:hypothetical protein [Rhodospirillaceae bacterium]HRJ12557.1 TcpQ domain-containing protein [Alphaproteobacteria bacterium]
MMPRYFIATALFTILTAGPAMASFTLIAPEPTAPGETAITSIPLAPAASAPAMQQPAAPTNTFQQMRVGPPVIEMEAAPAPRTMMAPAPQNSMMATPATLRPPQSFEAPVRGFGKDIPLVIAAQQIAPEDRQIAFGQGVDPSMPISWSGGKGWRNVLSDALSNRGLQMAEQGNILFISRGNSAGGVSNASLMMEPKSMRAQEWQPQNTMQMTPQQQPAYLPPTAPPQFDNGPTNSVALPTMVMPPAQPVMPPMQQQTTMMPMNNMAAPAPQAMVANQPVIPQQQPMMMQPAPTAIQSTVVEVPLAPQPIPVGSAPLPQMTMMPPASAVAMTAVTPTNSETIASGSWYAGSGKTLKQTLEDWSARANMTLRWDSEFDYPVQSNVNFDGDYEAAVRTLLRGFSSAQPQPIARLYRPNAGAPGVLLVTTRGNDMSTGR